MDFYANEYDGCVFNRMKDGIQTTVVLYVDDLFITSVKSIYIDEVINGISKKYGKLQTTCGKRVSFLGMNFDFQKPGKVSVEMKGYIDGLLQQTGTTGTALSPASGNLFNVDESASLEKGMKDIFHTRIAKLLYLAKRIRPDILLPVNYLCTRVSNPTEDDWTKLEKILKYLNGTKGYNLVLCCKDLALKGYVDASYAPHLDAKSHTGFMLTLGEGALLCRSSKQRIVTKSSTEAELVGASDMAADILNANNFMKCQGYDMKVPVLLQDNKSAIKLLENGRESSQRTRHLNVRYFWLKEKVADKELCILYEPTETMAADLLTKPLGGEQFNKLRKLVVNSVKNL
jgi:hypothetical protein